MARGWSGASKRIDGSVLVGPVTIRDWRIPIIRKFLLDLSQEGICLILGAGAARNVVPMTPKEITATAWKLLQSQNSVQVLSSDEKKQFACYPEIKFLTRLLQSMPTGAWDRFVLDSLCPGKATVILSDVFSPQSEIPSELIKIYDVIENKQGEIISFNYDRIAELQSRFRVIAPHGQRPKLLGNSIIGPSIRERVEDYNVFVPSDWHLPVVENEKVRGRPAYQEMLNAWRKARSIVFIGYGFGGGDDALSFEDFGRNVNPAARIHVLCPRPDNTDLCKQIGHVITGRGSNFRILGLPFSWRAFVKAVIDVLGSIKANHICFAIGKEAEIAIAHDKFQGRFDY